MYGKDILKYNRAGLMINRIIESVTKILGSVLKYLARYRLLKSTGNGIIISKSAFENLIPCDNAIPLITNKTSMRLKVVSSSW